MLLTLKPGASLESARTAVTQATDRYGKPRIQDHDQYRATATSGVNTILGLVYVMLALAIIIALMGVANTLTLSIHERTRELGLLRAVGQTRSQLRAMIRWEAVIISVFGTLGGAYTRTGGLPGSAACLMMSATRTLLPSRPLSNTSVLPGRRTGTNC